MPRWETDTILFFFQIVLEKKGTVFAFDIQETALINTRARLAEHDALQQCSLHLLGHQFIDTVLLDSTLISAAIFNLGYLPGSDKQIVTTGTHTIQAIKQLMPRLKQNGLIVLVVYSGHAGGHDELEQLQNFVNQLPQQHYAVLNYRFTNQVNHPPQLIVIEKM